jgi:hypothetical protein
MFNFKAKEEEKVLTPINITDLLDGVNMTSADISIKPLSSKSENVKSEVSVNKDKLVTMINKIKES